MSETRKPYDGEPDMPPKVEYQSAVSGVWYSVAAAAGDICAVRIDGVLFKRDPPFEPDDQDCRNLPV